MQILRSKWNFYLTKNNRYNNIFIGDYKNLELKIDNLHVLIKNKHKLIEDYKQVRFYQLNEKIKFHIKNYNINEDLIEYLRAHNTEANQFSKLFYVYNLKFKNWISEYMFYRRIIKFRANEFNLSTNSNLLNLINKNRLDINNKTLIENFTTNFVAEQNQNNISRFNRVFPIEDQFDLINLFNIIFSDEFYVNKDLMQYLKKKILQQIDSFSIEQASFIALQLVKNNYKNQNIISKLTSKIEAEFQTSNQSNRYLEELLFLSRHGKVNIQIDSKIPRLILQKDLFYLMNNTQEINKNIDLIITEYKQFIKSQQTLHNKINTSIFIFLDLERVKSNIEMLNNKKISNLSDITIQNVFKLATLELDNFKVDYSNTNNEEYKLKLKANVIEQTKLIIKILEMLPILHIKYKVLIQKYFKTIIPIIIKFLNETSDLHSLNTEITYLSRFDNVLKYLTQINQQV